MATIEGPPIAKNQPRGVWVYHHAPDCAKVNDPTFGPLAYPDPERECTCGEAQSGDAASAAVGKSNRVNSDRPSAAGDSPQALREALQSLRNEIVGVMGLASAAIQREIGSTNIRCLERRIDEADRALRSSSAGDEPREEPNGKS